MTEFEFDSSVTRLLDRYAWPTQRASDWSDVLRRADLERPRRKRRLVALLAGLALLLALGGTAYGLAREYLLGDPAPDSVKGQARLLNEVRGELIPRVHEGPGIRVEETRLAASLNASTGPVYLWMAPAEHGLCLFMQIVGTEMPDGRPNLGGGCGRGTRTIDWGVSATRVGDGRLLPLLSGVVSEQVARVELTVGGNSNNVPLQGRFFLVELPGVTSEPDWDPPQVRLVAYDSAGRELASEKSRPPILSSRRPIPIDVSGHQPVIEISTRRTKKPVKLYVVERDGGRCTVLTSPGRRSQGCGGRQLRPREVAVHPNQIGSLPNGILLLWGEVGLAITSLELHFEDGRVEQLPLAQRFALYQVDPADFDPGRRPLRLIGRDEAGKAVGERRLGPWKR